MCFIFAWLIIRLLCYLTWKMSLVLSQIPQFTFWQRDKNICGFQEKGKIIHMDVIEGLVWIKNGKTDVSNYNTSNNGLNISL